MCITANGATTNHNYHIFIVGMIMFHQLSRHAILLHRKRSASLSFVIHLINQKTTRNCWSQGLPLVPKLSQENISLNLTSCSWMHMDLAAHMRLHALCACDEE